MSGRIVCLSFFLLSTATSSDVFLWTNNPPSDSSTEEQWERVGLEQADSAQILVIITSEDDGCVTELRPEGRLVIHGAPKDVEDRLLELAEKRRENNSIIRVSGKEIHKLEMPSVPSVYILHIDASSVATASKFITNVKQSDLDATVFATVYDSSLKESWRGRRLLAETSNSSLPPSRVFVVAKNPDHTYFLLHAKELSIQLQSNKDKRDNITGTCCHDSKSHNYSATFINGSDTIVSGDNHTMTFNVSQVFPPNGPLKVLNAKLSVHVAANNNSYWSVKYMEFQADVNGDGKCAFIRPSFSHGTSYQIDPFRNITFDATGRANVSFSDYVDDCVGYFSPATWAGVITSLLLGLILFLAIYIMLGMQVMDRFDDPKGKTISVQAT